jgi:uncharacterized membrane protein
MRLEFSIDIERPPREVFAVVANLENDPRWQGAILEARKLSRGPIAAGTRFLHVARIMGTKTRFDIEFLEHAPFSRYVLNCVAGPFVFTTEVRFEAVAGGTRIVTLVQGSPSGVLRLAAVTLSNHRRGEIEADLRNLKRLMEAAAL